MTQRKKQAGIIVLVSLALRLAIAPWFHGFQYDMFIYGNWADTLVHRSLGSFYAIAESPDHLPGDLFIHWCIGNLFQLFGGENFYGPAYRYILKAFPALVDCLLVWLAYRFVASRTSSDSAIRLCWALAFAPALIFISAAWGQWDTISMTIFLAGMMLLWSDRPKPMLAALLFAWSLLIKPPLFLLVLPAVAAYVWTAWNRQKSIRPLIGTLAGMTFVAMTTVTLLMFPFGMTWLDAMGKPSLQGQLRVAADLYPFTTLGAANIWMIPLGSADRVSDSQTVLGVSLQTIGLMLMALTGGVVIYRAIRDRMKPFVMIWAMVMLNYGYFLVLTRSHERYLFPAVVMLAILAAMTGWRPLVSRLFLACSLVYFINLVMVYRMPPGGFGVVAFESLSIANLVIFAMLLFIPMREIESTCPSLPGEVRTAPESHREG